MPFNNVHKKEQPPYLRLESFYKKVHCALTNLKALESKHMNETLMVRIFKINAFYRF